jgi:hypothetical protein
VRQGCVLGTVLVRQAIASIYSSFRRELGHYGFMFALSDDVHRIGQPNIEACTMVVAQELYKKASLRIG